MIALALAALTLAVPAGVRIPARLSEPLSAASVHVGERFTFRTTATVRAGAVTIPAGTRGVGVITAAKPGKQGLKPSTMDAVPRRLMLADGTTVPVRPAANDEATLNQTRRARGIPAVLPIAGFTVLGHQAPTVNLARSTRFTVVTTAGSRR